MASNISAMAASERENRGGIGELAGRKRTKREDEMNLEKAKNERDALRYERKREIERDRRIEVANNKKAKISRDLDRDVSEKIALGLAQPQSKQSMFDQRLYNQTSGLEHVN